MQTDKISEILNQNDQNKTFKKGNQKLKKIQIKNNKYKKTENDSLESIRN